MADMFREYSTLVERFRRVVTVDPLNMKNKEAKQKYWQELNAFDTFLQVIMEEEIFKRTKAIFNKSFSETPR